MSEVGLIQVGQYKLVSISDDKPALSIKHRPKTLTKNTDKIDYILKC